MTSHDIGTIVFSPNGFGVRLLTNYGELHFSSEEFNYYQAIYNVLTTSSSSPIDLRSLRGSKDKDGSLSSKNSIGKHNKEDKLSLGSYQLLSILIRTDISWVNIDRIVYCALDCINVKDTRCCKDNSSSSSEPTKSRLGELKKGPVSPTSNSRLTALSPEQRTPKSSKLKNGNTFPDVKSSPQKLRVPWVYTKSKNLIDGVDSLSLSTWLMVCKLIAVYQSLHLLPSKKLLKGLLANSSKHSDQWAYKNLQVEAVQFPDLKLNGSGDSFNHNGNNELNLENMGFVNFNIHRVPHRFNAGVFMKDFIVEVSGWQVCGEEDSFSGRQHVKFKLTSTAHIACSIPELDSDILEPSQPLMEKYTVERRYSDFEALVIIMLKNHKGCVIPPIPEKQWGHNFLTTPLSAASEAMIKQRALELQLFLNDLMQHPMLRYSFELQVFLESSVAGYKSFVEMHRTMLDESGLAIVTRKSASGHRRTSYGHGLNGVFGIGNDTKDQNGQGNNGMDMTKMIADTIVTGAQFMAANSPVSYSYITSIWGVVSKSVPSILSTPSVGSLSSNSPSTTSPFTRSSSSNSTPWSAASYTQMFSLGSASASSPSSQTVNPISSPSVNPEGNNAATSSIHTETKFLENSASKMENITNTNKKVAAWMTAELQYSNDLTKIGYAFQNISEFEISSILARYYQQCEDTILKISKVHLEIYDRQSSLICTPLAHMSRYVDCYRTALLQRSKAVELLHQALKKEDDAKQHLEFLSSGKLPTGGAVVHNGNQSQGYVEDSKIVYSDVEMKEDSAENNAIFVENATSKLKELGKESSLSQEHEMNLRRKAEMQEIEQRINIAKLKLVQEEDNVETSKKEETKLTKRLKKESKLMEDKGRALLVNSMVSLVRSRIDSSRQNRLLLEALRDSLCSDS